MFKEELIIVRHGRSRHNTRDSEDLNAPLTEWGVQQAKNVGSFFNEEVNLKDHTLYTSPFHRCIQTINPIVGGLTPVPIIQPLLREYLNHSGRAVFVPNLEDSLPNFDWSLFPKEGVWFTEEFNEVFLHRMHDAYNSLAPKSLVVTHGLPALTLVEIAINPALSSVPVWDHSLDNCSITIIRKGRLIWYGRNLYHEMDYDPKFYRRDWDGVVQREHSPSTTIRPSRMNSTDLPCIW